MTPAEQAAEIVQWWREGTDNPDDWHAALAAKIAAAIEQARREGMEEAAKIADAAWPRIGDRVTVQQKIAAAIRARSQEREG